MAAAVGARLRRGGLGLLVLGLAVDDAGDVILRVLPDAFPDAHHVAAGRVHDHATFGLDVFTGADFGAEGGNDDGITGLQEFEFLVRGLVGNDLDAHVADLVVDLRVVDDFAEHVNGRLWCVLGKIFPRGIGKVDGAFDAVAKAEFLRELHRQAVGGKHAAVGADVLDDFAPIMGQHLRRNRFHDVWAAEVDLFAGISFRSAVRFL
jgi:hypothetical protein